jgi:hypothetical protein
MSASTIVVVVFVFISLLLIIMFYAFYFSQGGSNINCYNCGEKLKFGEHKDYSVRDDDGRTQNICSSCYKRLVRINRKGKYW